MKNIINRAERTAVKGWMNIEEKMKWKVERTEGEVKELSTISLSFFRFLSANPVFYLNFQF